MNLPSNVTGLRLHGPEVDTLTSTLDEAIAICQDPVSKATLILMRKKLDFDFPKLTLWIMSRPPELLPLLEAMPRRPSLKGRITQETLAELTGYARESVNRMINESSRRKVVSDDRAAEAGE